MSSSSPPPNLTQSHSLLLSNNVRWRKPIMTTSLARNQRASSNIIYYNIGNCYVLLCPHAQSSRALFGCSLLMFCKTLDLAQHFGMFFFFRPYFAAAIASARWRCATMRCQMAEVKSVTRKNDFFSVGPRHQSHNIGWKLMFVYHWK